MCHHVWVFYPRGRGRPAAWSEIKAVCEVNGWKLTTRRTIFRKSPRFGSIPLVNPEDAFSLYKAMHHDRVCVLSIQFPRESGPFVCRRPNTTYCLTSHTVFSLREYCRNKAFFRRIYDGSAHPLRWVGGFKYWCSHVHCDSLQDPRVLPLHVFEARDGAPRRMLHRRNHSAFLEEHRFESGLKDLVGAVWRRADVRHSHVPQVVAGFPLPVGFHWDVSPRGHQVVRIYNPLREWLIRKHVNVAPNATIRGREPNAKRLC